MQKHGGFELGSTLESIADVELDRIASAAEIIAALAEIKTAGRNLLVISLCHLADLRRPSGRALSDDAAFDQALIERFLSLIQDGDCPTCLLCEHSFVFPDCLAPAAYLIIRPELMTLHANPGLSNTVSGICRGCATDGATLSERVLAHLQRYLFDIINLQPMREADPAVWH